MKCLILMCLALVAIQVSAAPASEENAVAVIDNADATSTGTEPTEGQAVQAATTETKTEENKDEEKKDAASTTDSTETDAKADSDENSDKDSNCPSFLQTIIERIFGREIGEGKVVEITFEPIDSEDKDNNDVDSPSPPSAIFERIINLIYSLPFMSGRGSESVSHRIAPLL